MKKRWIAMGTTLVMIVAMAFPAMAAAKYETARLRPDFTIVIDGKEKNFKRSDGSAAFALVYEDSTYLPLRAIGEALGKNVNWDEDTKTITLEGKRETKDSSNKDVEGKVKDVSVQIRKDFTIVIDGMEQTFRTSSGKEIYPLLYDDALCPYSSFGERIPFAYREESRIYHPWYDADVLKKYEKCGNCEYAYKVRYSDFISNYTKILHG